MIAWISDGTAGAQWSTAVRVRPESILSLQTDTRSMPRKSWREALAAYSSPATLVLLLLGFAAGLPYMLVFSTLSVWLREAGVARETIGFASLIGLAYAFKWVWSPLLDQWRLPLLGRLGRRRSWLVLAHVLISICLSPPAPGPPCRCSAGSAGAAPGWYWPRC